MLPILNTLFLLFAIYFVGCNWQTPCMSPTAARAGAESLPAESFSADAWRRTVDGWEKKQSWAPLYTSIPPTMQAAGLSICAAMLQVLLSLGALIAFPLDGPPAAGPGHGRPRSRRLPPRPIGRVPVRHLSTERTHS